MLKILRHLTRREWLFVGVSLVFIIMQVWLDLKLPDYMAEVTLLIQTEGTTVSDLWHPGLMMLLCAVISMVAAIIVGCFAARIAAGLAKRIRGMVFDKTISFSLAEMNHFSTPSLITRSTNDITQIQMIVAMGLQVIIKAPILAVWAIIKIYNKNLEWTAATGVVLLLLVTLILILVLVAIPKFKVIQTLTDNLNRITRENLTGLRVIRAYNAEDYQLRKFEKANTEVTSTNLFVNRIMALISPSMMLLMSGLSVAIYWIGAYLIQNANAVDKLPLFSNMVVFSSYAMQVIMAFMMVSMIFIMLPRAQVSAKRILEVLNTSSTINDGEHAIEGSIEEIQFNNVSFRYPNSEQNVLTNLQFTAKKGETIALIGSTGSGKTTAIQLIPRFFDVTEGEVLINGQNIKKFNQKALRDAIGYVSQSAFLFRGTVKSNVMYGSKEDRSMWLQEVISIAQGTEFVEKMENSYDAMIAQGGKNVSGGQKQRLSIARAIYKKPSIYLFDDSFSALDYETDRKLRSALKETTNDAITFIVAQRIGTIKEADRILVFDQGRIVGNGTHDELMVNCETYQEIAYSQLSKEELEHA
ncbi:ABC transporter ATP-binding protein [Paenibacillus gallinarum]|uniref:ABC transporter ATP-binding protein n=1 Tax=Paenibacillus gallinarum TaxID=2762232 RepID=A0ABR8SXL5_9BACL|nr:ABC transporter ATP-binding protein [Paenibacillus gallinarum]MBD7968266.1 ABC transporter ATP-binding protein [Paenibacillus gallinarum]